MSVKCGVALLLVACFAGFFAVSSAQEDRCEQGWSYYGDSCYFREAKNKKTWEEAQLHCENMKANLVTVNNEDEMEFVKSILGKYGSWCGLNNQDDKNNFVWQSGEQSDYTNWGQGQPKVTNKKRCVHIMFRKQAYKWETAQCSAKYRYTCEKVPSCNNSIKAVSAPVTRSTGSSRYGAWMKDPTGIMGNETIFVMTADRGNVVEQYENLQKLQAGVTRKKYQLPYDWDGTGAVVYGQYLYYNRERTIYIIKYNLQTESVEAQLALNSFTPRTIAYEWGGASGVDLAVDEHGLWVLWGVTGNGNRLTLGKIDVNRNVITQTWPLDTESMDTIGNAFVACGVVYCIDSFTDNPTTINFAYDTKTGNQWNPNIQFTNQYGYNTMVDYNPREKVLYAWDYNRMVTYSLTFE